MTREDLKERINEFPVVEFLQNGIPTGTSAVAMARPVHNMVQSNQVVEGWYGCEQGFSQWDTTSSNVTREDFNSLMSLGYNTLLRLLCGQHDVFNENVGKYNNGYPMGATIHDSRTGVAYVSPQEGLSTDKIGIVDCEATGINWIAQPNTERIASASFAIVESDNNQDIATVSWNGSIPLSNYVNDVGIYTDRRPGNTGTWEICSFTMLRDFYGWIDPVLAAYAFNRPLQDYNWKTDKFSRCQGVTWRILDSSRQFNLVLGSHLWISYYGNNRSSPQGREYDSPHLLPLYYRKGETYHIEVDLQDALLLQPPGITYAEERYDGLFGVSHRVYPYQYHMRQEFLPYLSPNPIFSLWALNCIELNIGVPSVLIH